MSGTLFFTTILLSFLGALAMVGILAKLDQALSPICPEDWLKEHFDEGRQDCPDCGGTLLDGPDKHIFLCEQCFAEFFVSGRDSQRLAPPGRGRSHLYGKKP